MKRVFGCSTITSPISAPLPVTKLSALGRKPASSAASMKMAALMGVSLDGFSTTVLPATSAAVAVPSMMASGKFHGGITTPTPSGM